MTALESYRRPDIVSPPVASSSAFARRATVGSSTSPYPFTNTFESPRPLSRNDRPGFEPYRSRRSTVSGLSQGHNVNDAAPLTVHGDANMMLSDSASPSPIMPNTSLLHGSSPGPSSSCGSPKHVHPTFEYEHSQFSPSLHSPLHDTFYLSDFPSHPRSMLPSSISSGTNSTIRPSTCHSGTTTTPALSPAASSSSFPLDPSMDLSNPSSPRHLPDPSTTALPRDELESELARLRHKVRDLEFINDLVRLRVAELESDNKTRLQSDLGLGLQLTPDTSSSNTPFPSSSANSTTNASPTFSFNELGQSPADWPSRTSARLKRFCALNRAGNALCAWHDSRRERRAYPPRMAPPNTLNCGCTFAEALFEESLARNGVGAFYPGENVRMDPALRNPLLKLLEQRYGYRDGDFERTSTGGWREGEDGHSWEQRATGARATSKRER